MKHLNNNELRGLRFENELLRIENKELKRDNKILSVLLCASSLLFIAYIILEQIL